MSRRILIVEDEPSLVLLLSDRLKREGYAVATASDGDAGLAQATAESYDLILLDIMLPRKNGLDLCRDLRRLGVDTPILMLTARGEVTDKIVGLKLGADDYLTKPFDVMELLARIEALLRRVPAPPSKPADSCQFADINVDFRGAEVFRAGEPIRLSAREFQLLRYLIEHRGAVVSREELLNEVWGYQTTPSTRTVDIHVAWLRQKIEPNPSHPQFILTVRGLGYKFAG